MSIARNILNKLGKAITHIGVRRSPKWEQVRRDYLRTYPTCAACGTTKQVQLHHIQPFHLFPEKELDPTNFIPLCESVGNEHHLEIGHCGNWLDYNKNVVQDAADELKRRAQK